MNNNRHIIIPQANPQANYFTHKKEIDTAVKRVLDSGQYILGQEVAAFESEFASYIGVHHAIGVGNGTDALEVALKACGIGAGDAVFTVSHTAVATVAAIELTGATPIFIDIDSLNYTMDPNCLEDTIKLIMSKASPFIGRPKAIVPVHLYGYPADMLSINAIAQKYDFKVIEDCAQSHGATINERKTGAWGNLAVFSFYPTKNLGALGDGGIVVTDDQELAEKVRVLRQYGWRDRYVSEIGGMNSRLDEIQAAILRVKLRYLDRENKKRLELAQYYDTNLSSEEVKLPQIQSDMIHVYHQYVLQLSSRDNLKIFLQKHNIGTQIHYPIPVHLQPAYRDRFSQLGPLIRTEKTASQILSLPMYPELTKHQMRYITEQIVRWINEDSPLN